MEENDSLPLSYLHEPYLTIDVYFEFYNFERPHQSLVGKTPAEIYWGREVAKKAA